MAKIAVDCDGVLADFVTAAVDVANSIWPAKLPHDYQPTEWNFGDALTKAEWQRVWEKIRTTPNWWLSLNAHSDNVGSLYKFFLTHRDQDVWVVTARTPTAGMTPAMQTAKWLESCGIMPVHNFMGVITCEADDKPSLYKAIGIEWSIDDKLETVQACQKLPNHRAYLLSRPWNISGVVHNRVDSLSSYFSAITADSLKPSL